MARKIIPDLFLMWTVSHVLPRRKAVGTFMLLPVTHTITRPHPIREPWDHPLLPPPSGT